jgi:hypothetical protein
VRYPAIHRQPRSRFSGNHDRITCKTAFDQSDIDQRHRRAPFSNSSCLGDTTLTATPGVHIENSIPSANRQKSGVGMRKKNDRSFFISLLIITTVRAIVKV